MSAVSQRAAAAFGAQVRQRQSRWWFVGCAIATAGCGLISNNLGADRLDDAATSDLRGVLSALTAVSLVALGLQLVLVALLSSPDGMRRPPRRPTLLWLIPAISLATGALALMIIHAPFGFRAQAASIIAVTVGLTAVTVPAGAVLLGDERWRDLGLITLSSALVRIALSAVLLVDGGLLSALTAVVGGTAFGTTLMLLAVRTVPRTTSWPPSALRHLAIGGVSALGLAVLLSSSSVAVRSRLGAGAEVFSACAAIARPGFLLIFAVASVFLPDIAKHPVGSPALRRAFHQAFLVTSAVAIAWVTAVMLLPALAGSTLSAESGQADVWSTARLLVVAFALDGLAVVSLVQYLAHGSRMAYCSWVGASSMIIAQLVVTTPQALATAALVSAIAFFVVVSLPALLRVQPLLSATVVEDQPLRHTHLMPGVTIVVPCYNPGPTVIETLRQIHDCLAGSGIEPSIIAVTDGSTDGSGELIDAAHIPSVEHRRHPVNRGKGAALRTGLAEARTPIVGFIDADGDLPAQQLAVMVQIQQETGAHIVFGSKRHGDSTVHAARLRRLYSRSYQHLIRLLFQIDIADTQTGIKVCSAEMLSCVLPELKEDRFALDLELFVAARSMGFSTFVETPVTLVRQAGSTISLRAVVGLIVDTFRIFWRAKVTLRYVRAATRRADSAAVV